MSKTAEVQRAAVRGNVSPRDFLPAAPTFDRTFGRTLDEGIFIIGKLRGEHCEVRIWEDGQCIVGFLPNFPLGITGDQATMARFFRG